MPLILNEDFPFTLSLFKRAQELALSHNIYNCHIRVASLCMETIGPVVINLERQLK